MSCVVAGPVMQATLQAYTTSWSYVLWGPWFEVPGGESVNATVKVTNATTNFRATASVQYAPVLTANPDAPTTLDATGTSTATLIESDISATTASKAWARIGVAVKCASGSFDQGDVTVTPYRTSCGRVLARGEIEINPSTATKPMYIALGGLHSTLSLVDLKAAVYAQDIEGSGSLQYQLVYRTYATDTNQPGTWQSLTSGAYTTLTNNAGDNTGELTPTLTGKSWVEVGLAVKPSTNDMTATLKVTVFGKLS